MKTAILKPLINEKSMNLVKTNFYTFEVSLNANKDEIRKLVKERFSVDPLAVKIINLHGKRRLQRTRRGYYQTASSKKAIVKIKKGQKIALFETVNPEEMQEVEVKTAEGEVIAKTKEKKSLLRGTKVKIEKADHETDEKRGQQDLKTSHKEKKK